jgi:hypothetical protein
MANIRRGLNRTSRAKSKRQVKARDRRPDLKLLPQLEAENAELRDRAAALMIQLQSLRDGLSPSRELPPNPGDGRDQAAAA